MSNVNRYIITITPLVDDDGADEEASHTTMRVEAEDGQVHIKELTVRVADNSRLTPGDLLNVDFDLLAQAFATRRPAAESGTTHTLAPVRHGESRASAARRAKTERAYRRMPDPDELRATYLKSRTITGVAEHYGVPTHTAQGWVTRLRRKGVLPANK